MSKDASQSPLGSMGRTTSRRRLLSLLGATGAAVLAGQVSRREARAGHNLTNTMHLSEANTAAGSSSLAANVPSTGGPTLRIESQHASGMSLELDGAQALKVVGRVSFSTVGSAVVPAGQSSVFVAEPAVSSGSHVSVTLMSPGSRHVRWVERQPGLGFTVHLSPPPTRTETDLTYWVVDPAAP